MSSRNRKKREKKRAKASGAQAPAAQDALDPTSERGDADDAEGPLDAEGDVDEATEASDFAADPAERVEQSPESEPPAPVVSEITELKPRRRKRGGAAADETAGADETERPAARERVDSDESPTEPEVAEDAAEEDEELGDDEVAETAKEAPKTRAQLKRVLESLIFVSDQVITAQQLGRITKTKVAEVREGLAELSIDYEGRGIELVEVNGGYQFRSAAASGPYVRVLVAQKPVRLTKAQLETLALIAYRQPITRPEVDDVRGVDSGSAIKVLLDRELVRILGRKEDAGRPLLYGTTPYFLEFFGMNTMQDLPTLREFTELSDEHRELFQRKTNEIGDLSAEAESPIGSGEDAEDPDDDGEGEVDESESGEAELADGPSDAPEPGTEPEDADGSSSDDTAEAGAHDALSMPDDSEDELQGELSDHSEESGWGDLDATALGDDEDVEEPTDADASNADSDGQADEPAAEPEDEDA